MTNASVCMSAHVINTAKKNNVIMQRTYRKNYRNLGEGSSKHSHGFLPVTQQMSNFTQVFITEPAKAMEYCLS